MKRYVLSASFLLLAFAVPAFAQSCDENAELWNQGTACRCVKGFIENQRRCVEFNLGSAKVRALEHKNAQNNCQALSRTLNEYARASGLSRVELVYYATGILANYGGQYFVEFGDSGFRSNYRDESNQVRHFVAYFTAGLTRSPAELIALLAELRDSNQQADIDLGNAAAALGKQAAESGYMLENIGRSIRAEICE